MRTSKIFLIAAPFLGNLALIPTQAQVVQQSTLELVNKVKPTELVPQIEIIAKAATEAARDETISRRVISSADLTRFGDSNIMEAMQRVPGVLVVNNQMQLIGLSANYTQVLINGEIPRGISVSELPITSIEKVEIYRGGNAQFSSQAIAGTINIVLKKIASTAQQQFRAAAAKAYGWSKNGDMFRSDKHGRIAYSLAVSGSESGSQSSMPIDSTTESLNAEGRVIAKYSQFIQRDADNKTFRISPRLQYKMDDGTNINLSSSVGTTQRVSSYAEQYQFDVGQPFPISTIEQSSRSKNYAGNTVANITTSMKNGVKINANVSMSGAKTTLGTLENTFDVGNTSFFNRSRTTTSSEKAIDFTGKVTIPTNAPHDIVAGWSVSKSMAKRLRAQLQDGPADNSSIDTQKTASTIDKMDFFIQDEWNFHKSASLYTGVRSETVQIVTEESTQESIRSSSRILSPVIQSLWKLTQQNTDRLRFGISRTYNSPTESQLVSPRWMAINNSIQTPNLKGNPRLRPEVAWSVDGSYEHDGTNGFNFTVRSKYSKIDDLIRGIRYYEDQIWWQSYNNAGPATSKSIEIESQFPLKLIADSSENINFSFSISKNWSEIKFLAPPDNYLSPISLSGSINIDYQARVLPLSMGLSLRTNDSQWQRQNVIQKELVKLSSDMSTYMLWKFDKKTQLRVGIANMLKKSGVYKTENFTDGITTNYEMYNHAYRKVTFNFEIKL